MSSALSEIPAARRRHVAGVLGLFSVLLVAIGAVTATGATSALLTAFVTIAFVAAAVLALLAWGVLASVRNEDAERRHQAALDAVLAETLAAASGTAAVREFTSHGCGHDHDPDELHVTDAPCEHDGAGSSCSHTCDTCVIARLRADERPPAAADRPRPTPSGNR